MAFLGGMGAKHLMVALVFNVYRMLKKMQLHRKIQRENFFNQPDFV